MQTALREALLSSEWHMNADNFDSGADKSYVSYDCCAVCDDGGEPLLLTDAVTHGLHLSLGHVAC